MKKRTFFQEYYYNEDFWHINTAPKSSLLNIELMGITYADPSYRISRTNQWDMYILEYVTEGVGHITCGKQKYRVAKGDAYLISKFTEHEYHADPDHPYKKIWINVSGDLVTQLLKAFRLSEPVVIRHVGGAYVLAEVFVDIDAHLLRQGKVLLFHLVDVFGHLVKHGIKNRADLFRIVFRV